MDTTPATDRAVDCFDAHAVELRPDMRDRVSHTVIDIRSGEGSTARFSDPDRAAYEEPVDGLL